MVLLHANILYMFLVDAALDYDEPTVYSDCPENCHKCMDACPTKAILGAGWLHPRDCAMNNHQLPMGAYPEDLLDKFGERIHGCDDCQLACPRNQAVLRRAEREDPLLEIIKREFDLNAILLLDK